MEAEVQKQEEPNLRFIYFGREKKNTSHRGVTCVGYDIISNKGHDVEILIGLSFCNPNDAFSRKRAHGIITGRINRGLFERLNLGDTDPTYENISSAIRKFISDSMPDGDYNTIVDYTGKNIPKEAMPHIAGVSLPWWFSGV